MALRFAHAGTIILCGLGWLGCATAPSGATAADLAKARDQNAPGATTFANECARCHGQRGEGLAGPAIMGPGALPEFPRTNVTSGDPTLYDPQMIQIQAQTRPAGAPSRDPFRNALDLYNYTAKHLPKPRADELKDTDYWAVVSYLLAAQGATLPPRGIGPADAASIPIPKR